MILKGSQRGGAGALAAHLFNQRDNDHVELLELRGFMSADLEGALSEADAVAKGTQCKQFLFSLSLNPPKAAQAGLETMLDAADRAEERLGLKGQPRAIVAHEKEGRRHIHVVWSRINVAEMKAINLPFFKNELRVLSKELYLEHGWDLPDGHKENGWKNPLNFTLDEWQQAKRLGLDPREIKQLFSEAWKRSDNAASFASALEQSGYFLAKGDRRGFVAVDVKGEVFSVARMAGVKTRDLEARLGAPDALPDVQSRKAQIDARMAEGLRDRLSELRASQREALRPLEAARRAMVETQRAERERLTAGQTRRREQENRERQARIRKGVRGVFDILTGRAAMIRRANEREAFDCYRRDRAQRETLYLAQLEEREGLQQRMTALRKAHRDAVMSAARHVLDLVREGRAPPPQPQPQPARGRPRRRGRDFDFEL